MTAFHKDRAPLDTIARARELLNKVGLFPVERSWTHRAGCVSCRIEDIELGYGTNGKGVTRELALASAYGEYLERLQTLVLVPSRFGLMPPIQSSFPDETEVDLATLRERLPELVEAILHDPESAARLRTARWRCLPYYDAVNHRIEQVPLVAEYACLSTGLCAGNTAAEALTEGLCEVAERFVARRVLAGEVDLPTIPHESLGPAAFALVEQMQAGGLQVVVKDASMAGRFPVVATIISDVQGTFALFRFGSSPLFEIALQRCLTETFQGLGSLADAAHWHAFDFKSHTAIAEQLADSRARALANEYGFFKAGVGRVPPAAILSTAKPHHERAFLDAWRGNPSALRFMIDRFARDGARVLIRDYSLLGFPAFRVIVPGRTEQLQFGGNTPLEDGLCEDEPGWFAEVRRPLLQLRKQSPEAIARLMAALERQQSEPFTRFDSEFSWPARLRGLLGLNAPATDILTATKTLPRLMLMLALRYGDLARAESYLRKHLKLVPSDVNAYSSACLAYLVRRNQGCSHERAALEVARFYGEELAVEVTDTLGNPENAFADFVLPDCGDCKVCPIHGDCRYDRWKSLAQAIAQLVEQFHPDHESLRAVCLP